MERASLASPTASQQNNHPGIPSSTETNNKFNRIGTSDLSYYKKLRRYIWSYCCRERAADHSPSISRKQERSIHGPQLPQPLQRDGPMSISPEDDNCNALDNIDDNLIGNYSDPNHEIIGQQIIFSTDSSVEVTDDDDLQNLSTPSHRTLPSPLAVMTLPSSMVYVKQSIRQYDKEEGNTFRRQQQLPATKNSTTNLSSSSSQPTKYTRTYVNGIIVDDDLFFDAKTS